MRRTESPILHREASALNRVADMFSLLSITATEAIVDSGH